MTNKRSTKRALLASVVSLLLCFTMLLGTTYAWFTDSVTSTNNIIKSGNLDIELEYWNGTKWVDVAGKSDILTNELWEPGVTEVAYLRVANAGSLALKYQFGINIVSEKDGVNVAGDPFKLSDYIMFGVVENVNGETGAYTKDAAGRAAAIAAVTDAKKISAGYTKSDSMKSGDELYLALVVYMPTTVDNAANHNGTDVPQIDLGINIMATQYTAEEDSFGNDYDYDAPIVSAPVARPEAPVTLKGAQDVMIELSQEVVDNLPDGVETISISISEPKVDATANTITFESIELVDQDGEVIDLESLNLTDKITVTLPAQTTFQKDTTVMIYHDGEYVANAVVGENGVISYEVAHLCEVTIGAVEEPSEDAATGNIEIGSVSQLFWFAQSVNKGNAYADKTVVLTADIDLNNVAWTPIGSEGNPFKGTFDGGKHTIENLYLNNPEGDCVALFGYITKAVQNVNIHNVNARGLMRVAAAVGATAPSAVIDNVHVSGSINIVADKYYAAGIVTHGYVNVKNCSVIAENVGYINGNEGIVGGICGWRGEGKTVMTNCHVKNIDMIGRAGIGGLAALIHYDNTISDCSVENVNLTRTRLDGWGSIGALCGNWGGVDTEGKAVYTITNNKINNVTLNGSAAKIFSVIYGSKYSTPEAEMPLVESGNVFTNITNNLVEVTVVSTATDLVTALKNGDNVVLANDLSLGQCTIGEDVVIYLNGNTLETTATITLSHNANLTMKGGNYEINNTANGNINAGNNSVLIFEDVNFSYNRLSSTKGTSTNRLGNVVSVYLSDADAKTAVDFKDCTFNNAQVSFSGNTNTTGEVEATFENCTFTALTNSAPIYVNSNVKGTIEVTDCTFNIQATASDANAIWVNSTTSTAVTVVATNNTFNATKATPTDSSVTGVNQIKVSGPITNLSFIGNKGTTSTVTETGTIKTGIAK